jgi:hypothetical protein
MCSCAAAAAAAILLLLLLLHSRPTAVTGSWLV